MWSIEATKERPMPETMEQVQQEAYMRGQQMQHWHQEQQRVVTEEALTLLAVVLQEIERRKKEYAVTLPIQFRQLLQRV